MDDDCVKDSRWCPKHQQWDDECPPSQYARECEFCGYGAATNGAPAWSSDYCPHDPDGEPCPDCGMMPTTAA